MVADLRDKIERMGQVNLMAIEEYEALEKRNDFLVTQEEDLRKARETLLGIVARIDKTIRDMFMETFDKVAENFRVSSAGCSTAARRASICSTRATRWNAASKSKRGRPARSRRASRCCPAASRR